MSHSDDVAALQRWTIAYAGRQRHLAEARRCEQDMKHEDEAALRALRVFGGHRSIGLLSGERFLVEDYRGSGLLTAAVQILDQRVCECENDNPDRQLFNWREDPDWWSCYQCDGRVRPLTNGEKTERGRN